MGQMHAGSPRRGKSSPPRSIGTCSFLLSAQSAHADKSWIVVFEWADDWRYRDPGTNNWVESGAGLNIGAMEAHDVPEDALQQIDGTTFAVKVPMNIVQRYPKKTIVIDHASYSRVRLD